MRNRTARRSRPTYLSNRGVGTLPWSYLFVIAICGCIIAAGFLLAARQHFVSMDLGMKNSKLRKQLEDLESENRRLMLAREVAISPIEITRTARNFGFVEITESPMAIPVVATQQSQKPDGPIAVKAMAIQDGRPDVIAASVTKTTYQRPAAAVSKPETAKKPVADKATDKNAKKTEKAKTVKLNNAIAKR